MELTWLYINNKVSGSTWFTSRWDNRTNTKNFVEATQLSLALTEILEEKHEHKLCQVQYHISLLDNYSLQSQTKSFSDKILFIGTFTYHHHGHPY